MQGSRAESWSRHWTGARLNLFDSLQDKQRVKRALSSKFFSRHAQSVLALYPLVDASRGEFALQKSVILKPSTPRRFSGVFPGDQNEG